MNATIHSDKRGLPFAITFDGSRGKIILPDEPECQDVWAKAEKINRVTHDGYDWELRCWSITGRSGALGQGDWSGLPHVTRERLRSEAKLALLASDFSNA